MAHFAQLNQDNTVLRVLVVSNADCLDSEGKESEAVGVAFCKNLFGEETVWVQTSYNNTIRGIYAPVGGSYIPERDIFVRPAPYPSWVLGDDNEWWPPVHPPEDDYQYEWDEGSTSWVLVTPEAV